MVIVVFHSLFGLRQVELAAADRLRTAGHRVLVPDLFSGATAPGDFEAGFALIDAIGWSTVLDRARSCLADAPDTAVLGGFSMGVGVVGALWPERLAAAGVFCLHAPTDVPLGVAAGTPVQLHVGVGDRFAPPDQVASFRESAARAGASAAVHQYPGAGHFFTDESLPDFEPNAADATWTRVLQMLDALG